MSLVHAARVALGLVAVCGIGCGVTLEAPERERAASGVTGGPRLPGSSWPSGPPSSRGSSAVVGPSVGSAARAGGAAADGGVDASSGPPEAVVEPEPEEVPPVRRVSRWAADRSLGGVARMEAAQRAREPLVRALFAQAQVAFPPAQLLLRAFKRERRLEVWAASKAGAPLVHVTTYEICFASGRLGPKRRQGDGQVPEGFYTLGYLNPSSSYHLSMLVTYPNESDRILGDQRDPGGEIMIHGDCRSAGCLAMSDERIEELWVMCTALMWKLGGQVQIHIFPSRDMAQLLAAEPTAEHRELWQDLKGGLDRFERDKRLPRVQIERDGRYHFR